MKSLKKLGRSAAIANLAIASLFLGQCFGGSSSSTSTDTSSSDAITLSTTVTAPSAVSSSVSALLKGGPRFAVTDTALPDTEVVVYNLTDHPDTPVTGSDGEDLGEAAIATATTDSEGNCTIEIDPDNVTEGDQILIEAGEITQLVEYGGETEVELPATDLSSTLAVQSWRTMLSNAGVDVTNLGSLNLGDPTVSDLITFDTRCFVEYNRRVFEADATATGLAGQVGMMREAFAQSYIAGSFGTAAEEYRSLGGTLSEATLTDLSEQTASALGMDTESVTSIAEIGLNGMSSLSQIVTSAIATDDEDTSTESFCDQIRADTTGDFLEQSVQTMVYASDSIGDFATAYGSAENVIGFLNVIENYRDETAGTWNFEDFQPHAMATVFNQFIGSASEGNIEFDADAIYGMMAYVPQSTEGDYNPTFYQQWGIAMVGTYEDANASGTFDPGACSTYYSAQLLGGGLVLDENSMDQVNFAASDGYVNFFQNTYQSGGTIGGVSANACLTDPSACQIIYQSGGEVFDLSGHGFEYDDSQTEIYAYVPPSTSGGGTGSYCGNMVCDASAGENANTCGIDCYDPNTAPVNPCGDGTCETGESTYCFIDCQGEFAENYGGSYGGTIYTPPSTTSGGTTSGGTTTTSGGTTTTSGSTTTTSGSTTTGGTTSGTTTTGGTTSGTTTTGGTTTTSGSTTTTSGGTTSGTTTTGGTTSGTTTTGGTTSGTTTTGGTTSGTTTTGGTTSGTTTTSGSTTTSGGQSTQCTTCQQTHNCSSFGAPGSAGFNQCSGQYCSSVCTQQ